MGFRRWLVVGLCFCIFAGCKSAQSYHDYCGPMPDEGGDFLFRKNSVLGGDPAMKRMDEEPADQGEEPKETGPEPTPAPPPDQQPAPGMDMQGYRPGVSPDTDDAADEMGEEEADELADEGADPEFDEELSESQNDVNDEVASERREASASTAQWHAPAKNARAPVRQVRFQAE